MAVMQNASRPIYGQLQISHAAGAKIKLRTSCLIDWTVTQYPDIALQQVIILSKYLRQMRRAGFFLAFKKYLQVYADRDLRRLQRVNRSEQRLDGSFVVACRARIDAPFRIQWRLQRFQRDCLAFHGTVTEYGLPWIAGPLRLIHRLPIIVRVKKQRMLCAR